MSTASAIVNLGAELVVFVAAASLFLVATVRPEFLATDMGTRRWVRSLLQAAAVLGAFGAVGQGLAVDVDPGAGWFTAVRLAFAVALLIAATGVRGRPARPALFAAAGLLLGAEGLYAADQTIGAALVRGAAGLAVGVAAATGARQSIAVRIATAATALLLIVVLVLSSALSVVVSGNISDEALRRAEDRALSRATFVAGRADDAAGQSDSIVSVLSGADVFQDAVRTDEYGAVQGALEGLLSIYRQVDFMSFIDAGGRARVGVGIDQSDFVELAGSSAVSDALAGNAAASVDIVGSGLMALGAIPVSTPDARGAPQQVGAIVSGFRIDAALLDELLQTERGTSFAVVTRDQVLAATGGASPESVREVVGEDLAPGIARQVLAAGTPISGETSVRGEDAFIAVAPIVASDGRSVAAFAVNIDTTLVDDTLTSLFRTLFLVALGASVVAFLFATLGGARVTAPLRQLTMAAERVAAGDLSARAEVVSEDELGTLGASFDTMTASIEGMTREIREAAAQTAAILSGMADGLVAADPDGLVVAMNPAAERMLGMREPRALGKPIEALIKGTENSGRPLAERLAGEMRRPWSVNGRLSRRRGTVAVAISGAPIADDRGDLIGRVYVMRDIQREAEVEAMKSEFLANISHELRTPLTPIKGYAEVMLSRDVPKARQRQFLGTILESAERLERYVDMLVNFSAMEAGRFELQVSEVDLNQMVRRVGERWRARTKAHRFDLKVAARLPKVTADERLLERAVNEVVDNAVKYSPNGGKIEITTRVRGSGNGRRVEVVVADKGIGIEPADLDAIFADFSQLDGSSTRRFGGLGLGLSFVHRVIRAHQGTLEATSTSGSGSSFVLSLPPNLSVGARRKRPSTRARPSRARAAGAGSPRRAARPPASPKSARGRG